MEPDDRELIQMLDASGIRTVLLVREEGGYAQEVAIGCAAESILAARQCAYVYANQLDDNSWAVFILPDGG